MKCGTGRIFSGHSSFIGLVAVLSACEAGLMSGLKVLQAFIIVFSKGSG